MIQFYSKIVDLIDKEADEYSIALLIKAMKQFQDKGDKWSKIDEQIAPLINNPHNL